MLVRIWKHGNVEFRVEMRPFRVADLEGLSPNYVKQTIKNNQFLFIRSVDGVVTARRWSDDFPQIRDHMTDRIRATTAREDVAQRLWSITVNREHRLREAVILPSLDADRMTTDALIDALPPLPIVEVVPKPTLWDKVKKKWNTLMKKIWKN